MTDEDALPIQPRRRGRPRATQPSKSDVVLRAALRCFATHGYDGSSLRQIASEAGVDVALLSHRFGSKLGLWKAVVDGIAPYVTAAMPAIRADTLSLSPAVRLSLASEQMIDVVCETPFLANFTVKETAQQNARFDYIYERLIKPTHDLMVPLIEQARDAGAIARSDPDVTFFALTGAIAMAVAARPFIRKFSSAADDDAVFRGELKRTILDTMFRPRVAPPV